MGVCVDVSVCVWARRERESTCVWSVWMLLRVGVGPLSAHEWGPGRGTGSVWKWNSSRMPCRSWISLTFLLGATCISVQFGVTWSCIYDKNLWCTSEAQVINALVVSPWSTGEPWTERWQGVRQPDEKPLCVSFVYCVSTVQMTMSKRNSIYLYQISNEFELLFAERNTNSVV